MLLTLACLAGWSAKAGRSQELILTEQLWTWPASERANALYTWFPEVSPDPRLPPPGGPELAGKALEQVERDLPRMKIILHNGKAHPGWKAPRRDLCPLSPALILAHLWPRTPSKVRFCSILNLYLLYSLTRHGLWTWFKLDV